MKMELPKYKVINQTAFIKVDGKDKRVDLAYCILCNEPYPKLDDKFYCPRCHAIS